MVWIFHISVLFRVSYETPDIFSVILFCVDSVVLIGHLLIEWQAKADRNKRILKWCMPSFCAILLLIVSRYSAFYTKFYIGQKGFINFFKLFFLVSSDTEVITLFSKESRFYRLFLKANSVDLNDPIPLLHFTGQLFYLTLASLTLMSLRAFEGSNDDDDESLLDSKLETKKSPASIMSNLSKYIKKNKLGISEDNVKDESREIELQSSIIDDPPRSEGQAEPFGPELLPTAINDDEGSDEIQEDKPEDRGDRIMEQSSKVVNSGKKISNMATSMLSQIFTTVKENKTGVKIRDLLMHSNFLVFFGLLMLQRAITFSIIVYVCRQSTDLLDYCYILMDLGFFILLFHNLGGEFKAFGIEEFFEKNIEFFGKAFTKQLDKINIWSEEDPIFRSVPLPKEKDKYHYLMVQDIEQYCFYLSQLLLRLQKKVAGLTNLVSFIKLGIVTIKSYWNNWLIFYYMMDLKKKDSPNSGSDSSMKISTTLLVIIIVELLLIKFYRTLNDQKELEDEEESPEGIAAFCSMIQRKLNYYVAYVTESVWQKQQSKILNEIQLEVSNPFIPLRRFSKDSYFDEDDKKSVNSEEMDFVQQQMKMLGSTSSIAKHFSIFGRKTDLNAREKDRKEAESIIHKAVKMKVEPSEVYNKQKKQKLGSLKELYKIYIHSHSKVGKNLEIDFSKTFGQYAFEEPEILFEGKVNAFEENSVDYEEDEFDLGLSCYENNISFLLGVGTPRLLKILLLHKNKHKYHFCSVLRGTLYILRRLLLIPILYVVCAESNICNIPLLIIGIYYSFRSHKTILLDMRVFIPIFSCAFFFLFMWNSIIHSSRLKLASSSSFIRPVATSCNFL